MKEFFTNPIVLVPFIAFLISQFIKFGLQALKGDFNFRYLVRSGNMPSVHTAIVTALAVAVAFVEGIDSTVFGIALVFAMIVIYDAMNVRRAVGEQGNILERLLEIQKTGLITVQDDGTKERVKVSEVLGHTPIEVFTGAVIGLVTAFLLMSGYWSDRMVNYFWSYGAREFDITRIVMIVVFVVSIFGYIYLKRRPFRKLPSSRKLTSRVAYGLIFPSLFALFVLWSYDVNLQIFRSKIWLLLTGVSMVIYGALAIPSGVGDFLARRESEARELRAARKRKRQKRRKK